MPKRINSRLCLVAAAASLGLGAKADALGAQVRDTVAATGTVAGTVRDSSGLLLAGADLTVGTPAQRAITDSVGRFRVVGVPAGPAALQVRRLGYRALSLPVVVERGATVTVAVVLGRVPRELEPVLVEATRQPGARYLQGFYERRSKGHGYFVTRDQIAVREWGDLTNVLRSLVPAVRITSSRLARNSVRLRSNRCPPLVWLDGAPAAAAEFDLDFLSPESVSGIEVYPGPATVPVEFRSTRGLDACGVIVVWSRIEPPEPRERRGRDRRRAASDEPVAVRVYNAEEVDSAASVDSTGLSQPFYPDSLFAFRVTGEVIAQFVVDTSGVVVAGSFSALSSTHPAFTEAVRRSLHRSKFRPALRGGQRVRQVMVLPYRFVIENRG